MFVQLLLTASIICSSAFGSEKVLNIWWANLWYLMYIPGLTPECTDCKLFIIMGTVPIYRQSSFLTKERQKREKNMHTTKTCTPGLSVQFFLFENTLLILILAEHLRILTECF